MAALNEYIKVGDTYASPLIDFQGSQVVSVECCEDTDTISASLPINTMEIVVTWEPNGGYDLRNTPYGTTIWQMYKNGSNYSFKRKYFLKKIERLNTKNYKLYCHNIVGIFDYQYHSGGVYNGTTIENIVHEMLGNDSSRYNLIQMSSDVASTKICGWLPYDTIRNNLLRIMFAENIINSTVEFGTIDNIGHLYLTYPGTVASSIPSDNIYIDGNVEYADKVSSIQIVEHQFQKDISGDRVLLIDNTESTPANNELYIFNQAPINKDSFDIDGLTIIDSGENYAIVSGNGTLTGIPYYDNYKVVTRSITVNGESKSVSISDQYLVNQLNSENVADRLMSYYSSINKITANIKLGNQKPGNLYYFTNPFGETVNAYLQSLTYKDSSFPKGEGKFITNYSSAYRGNKYNYGVIAKEPGKITVPSGVSYLKLFVISAGDGGQSGLAGTVPEDESEGGIGGEAGDAGKGGWIKEYTITNPQAGEWRVRLGLGGVGGAKSTSTTTKNNGTSGGHSSITSPSGTVYSSNASGNYRLTKGISYIFDGKTYASDGIPGVKGGNGGHGSLNTDGGDGESVTYLGVTHRGGYGSKQNNYKFAVTPNRIGQLGGSGGNGAEAGGRGLDGIMARYTQAEVLGTNYEYAEADNAFSNFNQSDEAWRQSIFYGGFRFYPSLADEVIYPNNGNGGYGGPGGYGCGGYGGLSGDQNTENIDGTLITTRLRYTDTYGIYFKPTRASGNGYAGGKGATGLVIAYCDKDITYTKISHDVSAANVYIGLYNDPNHGQHDGKIDTYFKSISTTNKVLAQTSSHDYIEKVPDFRISESEAYITTTPGENNQYVYNRSVRGKKYASKITYCATEDYAETVIYTNEIASGGNYTDPANNPSIVETIVGAGSSYSYNYTLSWDRIEGSGGRYAIFYQIPTCKRPLTGSDWTYYSTLGIITVNDSLPRPSKTWTVSDDGQFARTSEHKAYIVVPYNNIGSPPLSGYWPDKNSQIAYLRRAGSYIDKEVKAVDIVISSEDS